MLSLFQQPGKQHPRLCAVQVGDAMAFRLLRRVRGSSVPVPVTTLEPDGAGLRETAPSNERTSWPHSCAVDDCNASQADSHCRALDRFAKFTLISDPLPLWREAVQYLAETAAQVCSQTSVSSTALTTP